MQISSKFSLVVRKYIHLEVSFKILQNSQENNCYGIFFSEFYECIMQAY